MKKRIKMLIAAGLSVVMLTSAAGCGKESVWKQRSIRILLYQRFRFL